jgi:hypothetical protein
MMDKLLKNMALGRIKKNDVSLSTEETEGDEYKTDEVLLRVNNSQKLVHLYKSEEEV